MLAVPLDSPSTAKLLGIDPGSHNLGVGILEVNLDTYQISASYAWTLYGQKMIGKDDWLNSTYGERFNRIRAIEDALYRIFITLDPYLIASESPFINPRHPHAGVVLTEVLCGIRSAIMRFNPFMGLFLVDPPTVKKSVGAPGNAQKEVMKLHVESLFRNSYCGETPIEDLDEHAVDALAVAHSLYLKEFTHVY